VRRGRQAEHEHARIRIAEPGHRAAPVVLAGECGTLLARHLLAPLHEAGAAPAADYPLL
jgi:hypothetical protein